ncbi:MAG: hypothetical protein ABTQ73_05400 [Caldilineales bacterium]
MQIPADLKRAVAKDAFVPLLSEGWFAAGVITALALGIVTFVFFGVVFFPGQPHAAPTLVRAVLVVASLIGTAGGLAGLRIHAWYQAAMRATGAQRRRLLHLAVAGHRLLVAALFLIFGLSALWVAWFVSPLAGVVAVVVFALELVAGTINVPNFLSLLCGRSVRFTQAARRLDRGLRVAIGLLALLVALPPLLNARPGAVFLVLTQLLSALALLWLPTMLAVARIHLAALRDPALDSASP